MAGEDKKEDKHVEALIEILKDPASMPAPPPIKNQISKMMEKLSIIGRGHRPKADFSMVVLSGCATTPRSRPTRVLAGIPSYETDGFTR